MEPVIIVANEYLWVEMKLGSIWVFVYLNHCVEAGVDPISPIMLGQDSCHKNDELRA